MLHFPPGSNPHLLQTFREPIVFLKAFCVPRHANRDRSKAQLSGRFADQLSALRRRNAIRVITEGRYLDW
jgi:hypothetical protein